MNEELYKKIKYAFYCRGRYPEIEDLHNLFEFVDQVLMVGKSEESEEEQKKSSPQKSQQSKKKSSSRRR